MKAMDLRTFTIWESLGGTMYAGESAEDVVNVDYEVYRKRLTDAELAAEWQQAKRHEAVAVICAKPNATAEIRRVGTLHRFATLPHYDEPTTQKVER